MSSIIGGKRRRKGIVTNTQGPYGFSKHMTINQLAKEHSKMLAEHRRILQGLPSETHSAVNEIAREHGGRPEDEWSFDPTADAMDWVDDDDDGLSAEGGEYDDVMRVAHQHIIVSNVLGSSTSQDRRARLRAQYTNWSDQMPALTRAYLDWKHKKHPASRPEQEQDQDVECRELPECCEFNVVAIETYESTSRSVARFGGEWANVSLIRSGLLGTVPVHPTIAIGLSTVELYHDYVGGIRGSVNYRTAFQRQVSAALGRDSDNWQIQNSCPCCDYKLQNEPKLSPAKLMAMDGNNSAKRIRNAGREDERVFDSSYFLSREQVNKFKDEVKHKPPPHSKNNDNGNDSEDDAPWLPDSRPDGQPSHEDRDHSKCTE
ncbi:hypothetical protein EWM64_g8573 [Hericium alpestre]|uniref:CxC1-like cysteine cluster associated with KDZ transposases domain-containing protein n=1 Tax=Hericium alpestre TaxID=135208 RepID=A0A4Y9ZMG2_9AGAM|nr:hypothetical protein EWM64_g8573 [Hericium alpestre]